MVRKATKKKTTKSYTKTAADYTTASTKSASDYAKAQTKSAYDFASFAKGFNPSQFFNLSSFQNFQPANFQSLIEQVMETSQKNIETLTACAQYCAEQAQGTLEENAAFATKLLQETASSMQDAFTGATTSDPREKLQEIGALAKSCMEKTTKQAKKTAENNIEIAQKIGDQISKRISASVEELRKAA